MRFLFILALFSFFLFSACKKDETEAFHPSFPAVANAGYDQHIFLPDDQVALDGASSTFYDSLIQFSWTQLSGPAAAELNNSDGIQCHATNLQQGDYQFLLSITQAGSVSTDTVDIFVGPFRSTVYLRTQFLKSLTTPGEKEIAYAGDKVVFGGRDAVFDMYDKGTKLWTVVSLSNTPSPRTTAITVQGVGDKFFFAGGFCADYSTSSRVDIFDVTHETWTTAEMSVARGAISILPVGSKVFFIGGTNNSGPFRVVDIYDLNTQTWSVSNLSAAGYYPGCASIMDTAYVWVDYSNQVEIYQPLSNSWQPLSGPNSKSLFSTAVLEGKVYFAGGQLSGSGATNQVDILDAATKSWSVQYLAWPKSMFSSVVMDSKILFLPGAENNRIDVFDTGTNTWGVGNPDFTLNFSKWINANGQLFATDGSSVWECKIDF